MSRQPVSPDDVVGTPPTAGAERDPVVTPGDAPLPFTDLPVRAPVTATSGTDTVAAHESKGWRRAADTIWRRNPRDQGMVGFTDAMAYFGAQGFDICVPLIDNQPYDLVVDDGAGLKKVQVKTTTHRSPYGRFVVKLATDGGNQSFHTRKAFDPTACDLLYVLTDDRERFLIPTKAISAKTTLNLGESMARYRVALEP
jgi:hypothetical protein